MPVSLLSKLRDVPLIFLDVETTGASPDHGDRVIELGMARVVNGEVLEVFDELIDPRRGIGAGITALTGISPAMVEGKPVFQELAGRALDFMRDAVLVGHNVPFDIGFLRAEFRKSSIDLAGELAGAHVLDTCRIARRRFGRGGNGLQRLAERFCCKDESAHRALADVLTTFRVMDKLFDPANGGGAGWSQSVLEAVQSQGGPIKLAGQPKANLLPLELEEALDLGRPVEMEYVDAREARSTRVITPIEVKRFKGEMILLAWCDMRKDRRTFKLERIVQFKRVDPDSQVEVATPLAMPASALAVKPRPEIEGMLFRASDLQNSARGPNPQLATFAAPAPAAFEGPSVAAEPPLPSLVARPSDPVDPNSPWQVRD